jgi:hypothetical protein
LELNQLLLPLRPLELELEEVYLERQLLLQEHLLLEVDYLDKSQQNRILDQVYHHLVEEEDCLVLHLRLLLRRPLQLLEEGCSHSVINQPRLRLSSQKPLHHHYSVPHPPPLRLLPPLRPHLHQLLLLVDYSVEEACLAQSQRRRRTRLLRLLLRYVISLRAERD